MDAQQQAYLAEAYSKITLEQPSMSGFLREVVDVLERNSILTPDRSLVDIGCGRGYLLEYLRRRGYGAVLGLDPNPSLVQAALSPVVRAGSFERNDLRDKSVDVALTCHTLHHLAEPWPVAALREMSRIARQAVVVIEINNTNIPMLVLSGLLWRQEVNAVRYNRRRVEFLFRRSGLDVVYSADMKAGYLSGDSLPHRLAAVLGTRPYNVVVGRPA